MISHISIKNFAIIDHAEIDFHPGLNIITGETGAGKSIVIEAVSLALGSRADTAFVRSGKEKAVVQLAADLLGEEYVITREVSSAGKNLCRINGEIVALSQLAPLCRKLADIHGQYDHQSLLNPEYHIHLIDSYKSDAISPAKEIVSELYKHYTQAQQTLDALLSGAAESERQRDFMRFELDEIEKSDLAIGEDTALSDQISALQNAEAIFSGLAGAYELLCGSDPAAMDILDKAAKNMADIGQYSAALRGLSEQFTDLYYTLDDLCREVRGQRDKITFSPEELDACLVRMDLIDTLKRKYGGSIEAVFAYADELAQKLSLIDNIDESKVKLTEEVARLEAQLSAASCELSDLRKRSAVELEEKIQNELKELNFSDSKLSIQFEKSPRFTENGTDIVEFLIRTNRGEPLKPLARIASGGEMSRIMLAFKNIIADYDRIPTMVFDEIDAGISGITASVVGKKMKEIANHHQVICITHLPQIAAFGQHNYRIHKESDEASTYTQITPLSQGEKTLEIARLLGGIHITETTLKSARELIEQSSS